jgi:uncharacterized protein YjbI with pentapeptide repeats
MAIPPPPGDEERRHRLAELTAHRRGNHIALLIGLLAVIGTSVYNFNTLRNSENQFTRTQQNFATQLRDTQTDVGQQLAQAEVIFERQQSDARYASILASLSSNETAVRVNGLRRLREYVQAKSNFVGESASAQQDEEKNAVKTVSVYVQTRAPSTVGGLKRYDAPNGLDVLLAMTDALRFLYQDGDYAIDLSHVDLHGAQLQQLPLSMPNHKADHDLDYMDLRSAGLEGSFLVDAQLKGSALTCADLSHADLRGADLSGADLRGADLLGARLDGTKLQGAWLQGSAVTLAQLRLAVGVSNLPGQDPPWPALTSAQCVPLARNQDGRSAAKGWAASGGAPSSAPAGFARR